MEWGQFYTFITINISLIYWLRQDKKDFINRMESWKDEIQKEMRDFHGKLCEIEGRKKK